MEELKREIVFRPAFDKRSSDPRKNYGVHGVEIVFYVKGPRGAVQFCIFTNWMLPHVQKEQDERMLMMPFSDSTLRALYHPMAADVGYHSPVPMYEDQTCISDECEVIGGKCYYDGSGLRAQEYFDILLKDGDEAVWKRLKGYYCSQFRDKT